MKKEKPKKSQEESNRLPSRCPVCGGQVTRHDVYLEDGVYFYEFRHGDMDRCQTTIMPELPGEQDDKA